MCDSHLEKNQPGEIFSVVDYVGIWNVASVYLEFTNVNRNVSCNSIEEVVHKNTLEGTS